MQAARGTSITDEVAPKRRRALLLFAGVAAVVYLIDQLTKMWAVQTLQGEPSREVIGEILRFTFVLNPGAAFGTGPQFTVALTVLAMIAVVVTCWVARRLGSVLWGLGLGALLGGVAGNLTDRLFREPGFMRGHVVDFLQLPNWPVFNVADIGINVAAGVIIVQFFRGIRVDGQREPAKGESVQETDDHA